MSDWTEHFIEHLNRLGYKEQPRQVGSLSLFPVGHPARQNIMERESYDNQTMQDMPKTETY